MSDDFYDNEYDPKKRVPNAAEYFTRWKEAAVVARHEPTAKLDLTYGPSAAETLDYFPARQATAPLLVFIHGGYWRAFDKSDFSWVAPAYVEAGVAVAVVNYALAPAVTLAEIVGQLRRSIAWLYSNAAELGADPNRIVCSGHSAGGHLTAMLLATNWFEVEASLPPRPLWAGVSISGIFDLEPLLKAEFLRSEIVLDANARHNLSPANLQPTSTSPLLTAAGELESSEFHRQNQLLLDRWGTTAVSGPLIVKGANHFSVCDDFADNNGKLFQATRAICLRPGTATN
nr:kynurenine formamidase-like [Nerophis lumbriciformis]